MNGQLSEQPLAELIHEISAKSLAGRLQLQHERVKVVIYFDQGELLYAAANVRSLRLREYLLKSGIAEAALARYDERRPDLGIAQALCTDHVLTPATAEQIQSKQVSDIVRLALSWTEGDWDFDPRSRLNDAPTIRVDTRSLLLDAGRRTAAKSARASFQERTELISPSSTPLGSEDLLPAEVFLLSRLERPTPLNELLAVSGLSESETLAHTYALALAGLLQRAAGTNVLGNQQSEPPRTKPVTVAREEQPVATPVEDKPAAEADDVQTFLEKLNRAQTHYEVLGVSKESSPAQMKTHYYELARRYHPDRFRKAEPKLVKELETAFARITQAYDTLRDDRSREGYDAKLQARLKAQQLADAAPKPTAPEKPVAVTSEKSDAPGVSVAERAEQQFKEGFAALKLGEKKTALGLFASAAKSVPKEPRYRAYYGQMLAEHEHTRRAAEAELQAAVKLDPGNAEYRTLLAELYQDLGLILRARGEAERALAADPNNQKAKDLLRALKSV